MEGAREGGVEGGIQGEGVIDVQVRDIKIENSDDRVTVAVAETITEPE